jgi:hypothetical protein
MTFELLRGFTWSAVLSEMADAASRFLTFILSGETLASGLWLTLVIVFLVLVVAGYASNFGATLDDSLPLD